MKTMKTEDAIGLVLGHDITEIIPGVFKGVAFKKGHVIQAEDVEHLLKIGKENIYVLSLGENEMHEDDAAIFVGNLIKSEYVRFTEPSEGKIDIFSNVNGLLKVDKDLLYEINDLGDLCFATLQGDRYIQAHTLIAGFRVIPLTVEKTKMNSIERLLELKRPLIEVKPFVPLKIALIVTGSEVYKGKIEDRFGPVISAKLSVYGYQVSSKTIVPDETEIIKEVIDREKELGAELIIITGGMSVDPDDKTPGAIKSTGAEVVVYGTPVLPGSMMMLAYLDDIPVVGLPGCVMFASATVFDLVLPKILANEKIKRKDIIQLGYGGLCLKCEKCTFPDCHFGKY